MDSIWRLAASSAISWIPLKDSSANASNFSALPSSASLLRLATSIMLPAVRAALSTFALAFMTSSLISLDNFGNGNGIFPTNPSRTISFINVFICACLFSASMLDAKVTKAPARSPSMLIFSAKGRTAFFSSSASFIATAISGLAISGLIPIFPDNSMTAFTSPLATRSKRPGSSASDPRCFLAIEAKGPPPPPPPPVMPPARPLAFAMTFSLSCLIIKSARFFIFRRSASFIFSSASRSAFALPITVVKRVKAAAAMGKNLNGLMIAPRHAHSKIKTM